MTALRARASWGHGQSLPHSLRSGQALSLPKGMAVPLPPRDTLEEQ